MFFRDVARIPDLAGGDSTGLAFSGPRLRSDQPGMGNAEPDCPA
jgi:hypothetical protein